MRGREATRPFVIANVSLGPHGKPWATWETLGPRKSNAAHGIPSLARHPEPKFHAEGQVGFLLLN